MASHHRYSHHTRRALGHAANLAARFRHPYQDTAHLLVGVVLAEGSVGAQVMQDFDLPPAVAEVYLKRLMTPVPESSEPIPRDASFDEALEQAEDEAQWLADHYIGTEHLLLGITRTNLGNAISLLRLLEITPEQIRRRVRHVIMDGRREFSLEAVRRNTRLSELSRRVLNAAEQAAVAHDHPTVGLGHLLLALSWERRGVMSDVLHNSGLNDDALLAGLQAREAPALVSVEVLLNEAIDKAQQLGSHYVGADHLLLVMALLPAGARLLARYGVSPDKVQRLLNKHLRTD
jgi:ATP-dependent Clp protease ATP-binding subunit ClpA